MQLQDLKPPVGSKTRRKIVGRGRGSGHGKTSGRGHKGQRSRSGRGVILGSEGGQMSLVRRLPKVGFNSRWPDVYQLVHLESLNRFKDGTVVNSELLKSEGIIKSARRPVKILSDGDIKKKLTIQANRFSKSAEEKIKSAGGKAEVVSLPAVGVSGNPEKAN